MVETGVGDDDQAGFLEGPSDIVGEVTRGEAASDRLRAGVGGKFEDSAVAVSP
jgi:hypothetical protein